MCMHRQLTSSPVHTGVDYIWIKMLGKLFHFHTTSSLLTTCPAPRTYISLFSQQKILIFRHLSAITLESFLSWSVGKNYLWEGSSKGIYFCSSVFFFFFHTAVYNVPWALRGAWGTLRLEWHTRGPVGTANLRSKSDPRSSTLIYPLKLQFSMRFFLFALKL